MTTVPSYARGSLFSFCGFTCKNMGQNLCVLFSFPLLYLFTCVQWTHFHPPFLTPSNRLGPNWSRTRKGPFHLGIGNGWCCPGIWYITWSSTVGKSYSLGKLYYALTLAAPCSSHQATACCLTWSIRVKTHSCVRSCVVTFPCTGVNRFSHCAMGLPMRASYGENPVPFDSWDPVGDKQYGTTVWFQWGLRPNRSDRQAAP